MILPYANPIPGELQNPGVAQTIRLERRVGQWLGNGVWEEDAEASIITGRGIVYPSTTDDLVALPEGERTVKSLTLYWPKKFHMNDRLMYGGEEYRIIHIAPWQKYGYQMAIAQVQHQHE
jgi:hypothetical protein